MTSKTKQDIIENQKKTNVIGRKYWDGKKHAWRKQDEPKKDGFKTIDQAEYIPRLIQNQKGAE